MNDEYENLYVNVLKSILIICKNTNSCKERYFNDSNNNNNSNNYLQHIIFIITTYNFYYYLNALDVSNISTI